jgi:hypothetical protein
MRLAAEFSPGGPQGVLPATGGPEEYCPQWRGLQVVYPFELDACTLE